MAPPRVLCQRALGTELKHILIPELNGAATPRRIPSARYTTSKHEHLPHDIFDDRSALGFSRR
jgi:hypothetical protein